MSDFQERVVLITGASAGIGAALAREFGRKGAKLILLARRIDRSIERTSHRNRSYWRSGFNICL